MKESTPHTTETTPRSDLTYAGEMEWDEPVVLHTFKGEDFRTTFCVDEESTVAEGTSQSNIDQV